MSDTSAPPERIYAILTSLDPHWTKVPPCPEGYWTAKTTWRDETEYILASRYDKAVKKHEGLEQNVSRKKRMLSDRSRQLNKAVGALEQALTWESRSNEAEQLSMQGDGEGWAQIKHEIQVEKRATTATLAELRSDSDE